MGVNPRMSTPYRLAPYSLRPCVIPAQAGIQVREEWAIHPFTLSIAKGTI